MATKHIKQILIDSRDRQYDTETGDCTFHLPIGLDGVKSIDLLAANIPMTMYNVNSSNNIVYFNDGVNQAVAIPVGNYDIFDLVTQLESSMNAVSGITFTVEYSLVTMKLTITGSAPFYYTFSNTTLSMASVLGFNNVNTASNTIQTADNVVNLSVPIYLKLVISELGSTTKSTNSYDNATFVVFTNVNNSEVQSYNNMSNYRQRVKVLNDNIQTISVKITDHNNRIVNLNGSHWSIMLGLNYTDCE